MTKAEIDVLSRAIGAMAQRWANERDSLERREKSGPIPTPEDHAGHDALLRELDRFVQWVYENAAEGDSAMAAGLRRKASTAITEAIRAHIPSFGRY